MQIILPQRELIAEGQRASKAYSITPGPHILHMLSNLYSDIPWAIVREYGTNMLDGYVKLPEGAPSIPPVIHLPSALEPYLEFKDYGVGMDWDTVWEVFTTYGASTKRGNNDEVGGLGVGAKVAFCYAGADQWTVESRFNGERMVFVATRDSEGMPTLLHVETLPSEEPNGVTVRIPLARDDFSIFREKVERFLMYFPMECTVVGDATFERTKPDYWMEGNGWGLQRQAFSPSHVIMGNIPYPLDRKVLIGEAGLNGQFLNTMTFDLRVGIGEVDLVPSREALQYTERTTARVVEAVAAFLREVEERAMKDIENATTLWEAMCLFYENWNIDGLKERFENVLWRGARLDLAEGIRVERSDLIQQFPDLRFDMLANPHRGATFKRACPAHMALHPATKTWVFVDDVGKGTQSRVREYLLAELTYYDYYRNRRKAKDYGRAYILSASGLTPDVLQEILGGFPVRLVSDLPTPPRKKASRSGSRGKAPLQLLDLSDGTWSEVARDADDGGYYVSLNRGKLVGVLSEHWLGNIIKKAQALGLFPKEPIYGIPRSQAHLETRSNWIAVVPFITQETERRVREAKKLLVQQQEISAVLRSTTARALLRLDLTHFSERSLVVRLQQDLEALQETTQITRQIQDLAAELFLPLPTKETAKPLKIAERLQKFERRYPMFVVAADMLPSQPWQLDNHEDTILAYLQK